MEEKEYTMFKGARPQIFKNAEALRERMTEEEEKLWQHLKGNQFHGLKFRRQHPLNIYVLDFYCHKLKLCIELDGGIHDEKNQKLYDEIRENYLKDSGLNVLRFKNQDVIENIDFVLNSIKKMIDKYEF